MILNKHITNSGHKTFCEVEKTLIDGFRGSEIVKCLDGKYGGIIKVIEFDKTLCGSHLLEPLPDKLWLWLNW